MSYQTIDRHDRAIPDYAEDGGDFFEGNDSGIATPVDDTAAVRLMKMHELQSQQQQQQLHHMPRASAPPQYNEEESKEAIEAKESDSLLGAGRGGYSNGSNGGGYGSRNISNYSNGNGHGSVYPVIPSSHHLQQPPSSNGFVWNYASPLRSDHPSRPLPLAIGHDAQGMPFEVFPSKIHVAGRHFHPRRAKNDAPDEPMYRMCPPCIHHAAHQSTDRYTTSAWLVACLLFPCGILCCLNMTESYCSRCNAVLES